MIMIIIMLVFSPRESRYRLPRVIKKLETEKTIIIIIIMPLFNAAMHAKCVYTVGTVLASS